ncbi:MULTISPECIES: hypothetical protein [unclassified Streptomyces]|uniref:hypothetical protein n=1 Tax=unclassified Streptomyces TaxID=2593676 RepID=UPI0006AFACC5|nr:MULTISPECIES: hypothetical protein [unclassified Streptomyces]
MPFVPQDLLDRISALEREVRQLRGRAQMRPRMDEISNGRVVIAEGGSLEVLAPDGTGLFGVGAFSTYFNHPDGSRQQGVIMQREDGTTAFSIRAFPDAELGGAGTQAVSIWDRSGHQVISDDTTSGRGIGSPALPVPFQPLPPANEVIETSSFVNCWFATIQAHNPVASLQLEFAAAPGATCEIKVQYRVASEANWTDIKTDSVAAPASATALVYKTAWYTFPLDRAEFEHVVFIRIQGRQKSGTGGVRVSCLGGFTRRTYGRDEIPEPPVQALAAARAFATAPVGDTVGPENGVDMPMQPPPFPQSPPKEDTADAA